MKKFIILEHPTDLKIEVFAKKKEEIFKNFLWALFQSQKPKLSEKKIKRKIKINSENLEMLLVDFLSEIIYLNQVKKEIYQGIIFKNFKDNHIEAEIIGQKYKRLKLEIKAATYHGLKIEKKKNFWKATVLFDI